jgi:hypothetical protein
LHSVSFRMRVKRLEAAFSAHSKDEWVDILLWGGSMLAHVTNGNVLVIKKMLRHKSIQNTMKYIQTIEFKEEDYEETVATTPEEIRQLGKAGWQKYDELMVNGIQIHFYRKPKRFGDLKNAL